MNSEPPRSAAPASPGRDRRVFYASLASGALIAQFVAGKATRDALFLSHFGLALLPPAMIAAAAVSALSVIGISRALSKLGPGRVVPATFVVGAALFLLEWGLSLANERAAALAVYAHSAFLGSAGVSAFWSLVNERFDPHAAKKVVGRIASGGTVGGVVGGVVVWRAADHLPIPTMLAVLAGINLVGLAGSLKIARPSEGHAGAARRRADAGEAHAPRTSGVAALRGTAYLRDLAALVATGGVVQALLDWLLSAHATRAYGQGNALLGFFALFNMIVGLASFAAQTGLAAWTLERHGLAGTLKVQPGAVIVAAAAALLLPQLGSVVLLRWVEAVTRNSLYRSAYELCYTPLPKDQKRASKTLIDVGFDRLGTAIGSGALLAIAGLAPLTSTRIVVASALALSAFAWLLAVRLHRGYVEALAESLRSGAVALDLHDTYDLTTRKTLAETTALLDRSKLLARIEEFHRTRQLEGKPERAAPSSRAVLGVGGAKADPSSPATPPDAAHESPPGEGDLASTHGPFFDRAVALLSLEPARVRAALADPLPAPLVALIIPLLANDAVVRDVLAALRRAAPRTTGLLVDHLLDAEVDPRVRRRLPRVLRACRTERAAAGLFAALSDPRFDVREQAGIALAELRAEAELRLLPDEVFAAVTRELTEGAAARSDGPRDDATRALGHVFTILGLVLDPEPLAIAFRAVRSGDATLRGTAFEYLDVVLPAAIRDLLFPLLGESSGSRGAGERRPSDLASDLLRARGTSSLPPR